MFIYIIGCPDLWISCLDFKRQRCNASNFLFFVFVLSAFMNEYHVWMKCVNFKSALFISKKCLPIAFTPLKSKEIFKLYKQQLRLCNHPVTEQNYKYYVNKIA